MLVNAVAPGFVATRMSVVDGVDELESEWFKDVYVGTASSRSAATPSRAEIAAARRLARERAEHLRHRPGVTVDGGLTVTF